MKGLHLGAPLDALVTADRAYAELLTLVEQSGGEPRSDALRSKEGLSVLAARVLDHCDGVGAGGSAYARVVPGSG